MRLAGEVADGVRLHPFCTRAYLEQTVMPNLALGFAKSGRRRKHFEVNGGGFLATGKRDEDVAKMTEWVRYRIGFYGSTPAYWPVLESAGFGELGEKLNHMTKRGQWDELAQQIPDDLLHACTVVGRHDEIAGIVASRYAGLSDTLQASASYETPSDLPSDLLQDLRRIPSVFAGFDAT